jgi:hypothetical protein
VAHTEDVAEGKVALDVFPDDAFIAVHTPDVRIQWFRAEPPLVKDDGDTSGVLFQNPEDGSTLSVTKHGEVIFMSAGHLINTPEAWEQAAITQGGPPAHPPAPPESPGAIGKDKPAARELPDTGPGDDPNVEPGASRPQANEKDERVDLHGRVGKAPIFRTTSGGTDILQFPLAVHVGEETKWETVLLFNERARKLRDSLDKGQQVQVIGYRGENVRKVQNAKTGEVGTKVFRFIRGVAVRAPKG